MSKVLALDQATRCSGYAIFENKKLIHYGKILTEDLDIGVRLNKIRNQVQLLIQQHEITEVVGLFEKSKNFLPKYRKV